MNKNLTDIEKAYIAGFIDGDGCINAQIVRRNDYKLKFQIRVSITLFQSTKRHWFLLQISKLLNCGTVRKRNDGISEYAICGIANVASLIQLLLPFLRLKYRQAILVQQILLSLSKNQHKQDFLIVCGLVDQIRLLNDSKNATITANIVANEYKLFPVETSL